MQELRGQLDGLDAEIYRTLAARQAVAVERSIQEVTRRVTNEETEETAAGFSIAPLDARKMGHRGLAEANECVPEVRRVAAQESQDLQDKVVEAGAKWDSLRKFRERSGDGQYILGVWH